MIKKFRYLFQVVVFLKLDQVDNIGRTGIKFFLSDDIKFPTEIINSFQADLIKVRSAFTIGINMISNTISLTLWITENFTWIMCLHACKCCTQSLVNSVVNEKSQWTKIN